MDKNNIRKILLSNINLIKINIKYPNNTSYKKIAMDILKNTIAECIDSKKVKLN